MDKNSLKKALKEGMLGEMDSVVLYETASRNADGEVKNFFDQRAEEEKKHYNYLLALYKQTDGGETHPEKILGKREAEPFSPVISSEFVKRIGKDQVLFSAMSTAALLELRSIEFYRKKKEETSDPALKTFFGVMEDWEKEHYETVLKIQEEAEHHYWEINRFEPF